MSIFKSSLKWLPAEYVDYCLTGQRRKMSPKQLLRKLKEAGFEFKKGGE